MLLERDFTDGRFAMNTNTELGERRGYFPADIGDSADGKQGF